MSSDTIQRCGHILFVWFGGTGEAQCINTLRLDRGLTFSREDKTIRAQYSDGESLVLDSFSSEQIARSAYARIQGAVRDYVRAQRIISAWTAAIKWVVLPITAFVTILALNAAAVALIEPRAAQAQQQPLPPQPTEPEATVQRAMPAAAPAALAPEKLAKLLQGGVEAGNFTVQLSSGDKGTLYVFSDPACPHCQRLDKELPKLADDYTIHLFPVTIIGGDDSMHNVARLLCAQPEQRAALWEKAIQGKELTEDECETGNIAAERNNKIFRGLHFAGVPTIINNDGVPTPDNVPNRAPAIRQWMEKNK